MRVRLGSAMPVGRRSVQQPHQLTAWWWSDIPSGRRAGRLLHVRRVEDSEMTKLYDDPAKFSEDLLAGFLDVYADRVLGVEGGVVRATETPGKVAVVVGGGSGHYPAFCGVVGPGFADGAVVGNVFTSPSTQDACSVGRAA